MPFADLAPPVQERVVCSIAAGIRYGVPVNILLAVAEREGGRPGDWVRNTNGTFDVGTMQLNTSYLASLRHWGITPADAARPGCYPYDLAAWRLGGHLRHDPGDLWQRAANYHSRTPMHNAPYRAFIMASALRWGNWLRARVATYETNQPAPTAAMRSAPILAAQVTSAAPGRSWVPTVDGSQYVPRTISFSR